MSVTNGFNLLEFSTYGMLEWAFVVVVGLFLIFLVIILPIMTFKKRKKTYKVAEVKPVLSSGNKKNVLYKADTGESVLFSNGNAWFINTQGQTEHFKAVEGKDVILSGKVIYLTKDVKKITITQDKDEIIKRSAYERQYVTFDFLTQNEVKLGQKSFLTEREIGHRKALQQQALETERKAQDLAEKKASKIQKKADKAFEKEEKKALALERKQKKNEE